MVSSSVWMMVLVMLMNEAFVKSGCSQVQGFSINSQFTQIYLTPWRPTPLLNT